MPPIPGFYFDHDRPMPLAVDAETEPRYDRGPPQEKDHS